MPGFWHSLKSALSPDTDRCPHCHENLAGEYVGTELIDRQESVRTQPSDPFDVRSRLIQVIVYTDTYWQDLKCKFCGHRWRERRQRTYRP